MRWIKKFLGLTTFLYAISYLPFATPVAAQQEFSSRFHSDYSVSEEGITTVTHAIELENLLSQVYASQYTLELGSTRVKNVQGLIDDKPITTLVKSEENTTQIKTIFDQPVVGKNQVLRFSVSYTNLDIATKNGRVLEVNIPRLAGAGDLSAYTITVSVPDSFDQPTLMTPPTSLIHSGGGKRTIEFTKEQITARGISILFGDHQVYDFTLGYTIQNPGVVPSLVSVALPPDTAYQRLFYEKIDPRPDNVTVDADGNWLAEFSLGPQETRNITATGQAVLYLEPSVSVKTPTAEAAYLSELPLWPVEDPEIVSLAQKLKTPENIYNYLVDNLDYNYGRIDAGESDRLGAKFALLNPQSVICTEFTDLFVTLARAAGIPARSQDGFAFTDNPKLRPLSLRLDVLHAWPEYYDATLGAWHPVDPTWGNTTKGIDYFSRWDLNHFTFAVHGLDSQTPYPAGAYKLSPAEGKDVNIAFSFDEPIVREDLAVDFSPPRFSFPSRTQPVSFIIRNQGNTALHEPIIEVSAPGYSILSAGTSSPRTIPPYGELTIPVTLKRLNLLPTDGTVTLRLNNHDYSYPLAASGPSDPEFVSALSQAALGGGLAFLAYAAGRLLVRRRFG